MQLKAVQKGQFGKINIISYFHPPYHSHTEEEKKEDIFYVIRYILCDKIYSV